MADISPQVVGSTEYGLYLEPPPALTRTLSSLVRAGRGAQLPATGPNLPAQYQTWVESERKAHMRHFHFDDQLFRKISPDWLTFRRFISQAQYGFCRILVYDVRMLQWFEKDGSRSGELFSALADVLPKSQVEELHARST